MLGLCISLAFIPFSSPSSWTVLHRNHRFLSLFLCKRLFLDCIHLSIGIFHHRHFFIPLQHHVSPFLWHLSCFIRHFSIDLLTIVPRHGLLLLCALPREPSWASVCFRMFGNLTLLSSTKQPTTLARLLTIPLLSRTTRLDSNLGPPLPHPKMMSCITIRPQAGAVFIKPPVCFLYSSTSLSRFLLFSFYRRNSSTRLFLKPRLPTGDDLLIDAFQQHRPLVHAAFVYRFIQRRNRSSLPFLPVLFPLSKKVIVVKSVHTYTPTAPRSILKLLLLVLTYVPTDLLFLFSV
ncbi:hypothetical protein PM082_019984 [Marasmius tenuissimus]|nr:hypothetical protein PM082_019984 [Marasmius tenuissimus]